MMKLRNNCLFNFEFRLNRNKIVIIKLYKKFEKLEMIVIKENEELKWERIYSKFEFLFWRFVNVEIEKQQ